MSGPKVKARVDLDATKNALEQLGLMHAAEQLPQLLNDAVKDDLAAHHFLDRLLAAEHTRREERRIKTSLRLSGLPTGQTLGDFDWSFQPTIDRKRVETLATCAWIRQHETVMATALLDRLLHRCHVLSLRGRSYRLKELEKMLK